MNRTEILVKAIDRWGAQMQEDICIEEMSELTKALLKLRRQDKISRVSATGFALKGNIREEIADVQITLDQMRLIYGNTTDQEEFKLNRLAQRLESENHA